ncbi:MAG TPA: MmcQ/YjbR family DNA-binding protein [Flavipsychrobacter sp.]|nr:MmcQ/YjbR family DNA-binding protein [Flavipsychrobacter sp.]
MTHETLSEFCLQFPGAAEGIKWEDHTCFMVAEKIFCMTGMNSSSAVNIKTTPEDFELLTERDGITQAPYMARNQWISIQKRNALKSDEWKYYLTRSYELIRSKLTKKQQAELQ